MKRRCDKIFTVVNHNPCVGKEAFSHLPKDPEALLERFHSRLVVFTYSKLLKEILFREFLSSFSVFKEIWRTFHSPVFILFS